MGIPVFQIMYYHANDLSQSVSTGSERTALHFTGNRDSMTTFDDRKPKLLQFIFTCTSGSESDIKTTLTCKLDRIAAAINKRVQHKCRKLLTKSRFLFTLTNIPRKLLRKVPI